MFLTRCFDVIVVISSGLMVTRVSHSLKSSSLIQSSEMSSILRPKTATTSWPRWTSRPRRSWRMTIEVWFQLDIAINHEFIFCVSGASSPDSYGSSKENDPEMCSVSNVFHQQSKSGEYHSMTSWTIFIIFLFSAYSTRKRNGLKTPLSKPALAS